MSLVKIAALFETSLQNKITAAATTMTLVSGTDKDGNALSGLYGFVINEGASNEEFVIGTVSGTTVSGLLRGISVSNPNTTGTGQSHRRGETVKITNYPILEQIATILRSGGTIEGLIEFLNTARPKLDSDIDALADEEFITKGELNRTALGTLTNNRLVEAGNAGETVAAGNLLYLDVADTEWKLVDATDPAKCQNVQLGIAQGAGTDGNPISGGILRRGVDTHQTGLSAGAYYASDTPGAISSSAGTYEVTIGSYLSATELYFDPRFNQQITEDEQDALAGTSGTPSSSNKYVTNDDTATSGASKVLRLDGSGNLPALDGSALTNISPIKEYIAGENITADDAVTAGFYQADGGIQYDTSVQKNGASASGTITQALTIANNTNRVLVATILHRSGTSPTNVRYNGVAMTLVTSEGFAGVATLNTYVLFAPDAGAAYNFSFEGLAVQYAITLHSYYNVTQAVHLSSDMASSSSVVTLTSTPTLDGTMIYSAMAKAVASSFAGIVNMANNRLDFSSSNLTLYVGDSGIVYPKKATTVSSTTTGDNAMASLVFSPITAPTFGAVLKTDGSALANACNLDKANNFIGFATETKNAGETIKVQTDGVYSSLTGLNPFQTYYVSDTNGAIATSAGTISKKVGKAISATDLLIQHDN